MNHRIVPVTAGNSELWSAFVAGNPHRAAGHLLEVFKLEELAARAENHSVLMLGEHDNVLAIMPLFYVRRVVARIFTIRVLTSGTHHGSGPLFDQRLAPKIQGRLLDALAEYIDQVSVRLQVDQVEISYPTVVGDQLAVEAFGYFPWRGYGYEERSGVSLVVDLTCSDDALSGGLDAKCRNKIKRSTSGGAIARVITTRDEWMNLETLNKDTLGEEAHSRESLAAMWDGFVGHGHAFVVLVEVGQTPASVVLVTTVGSAAYYWCGFNARPMTLPGTNTLALWTAMLEAKRRGVHYFEVGSLEFSDAKQINIGRFKAQFGGKPTYHLMGVKQFRPARGLGIELAGRGLRAVRRVLRRESPQTASSGSSSSASNSSE